WENSKVFKKAEQEVLVVAPQRNNGGRPLAACKPLDHTDGAKPAVYIVPQKYRERLIKRATVEIGLDALGHLAKQVIPPVDVAHAVHPHSIRNTALNWSLRRLLKRAPERIDPT